MGFFFPLLPFLLGSVSPSTQPRFRHQLKKKPILHSLVREEMQETQHAPLRHHSRLPPNTCQSGGALLIITPTQLPTEANAQPPAPPHTCTRHTRTHKASSQGLSAGSWWPFGAHDLHGFPVRLLSSGEILCTAKTLNITVKILSPLITTLKYRRMALSHKALFIDTMLRQLANESKESLMSMFRQKCQVSWLKL